MNPISTATRTWVTQNWGGFPVGDGFILKSSNETLLSSGISIASSMRSVVSGITESQVKESLRWSPSIPPSCPATSIIVVTQAGGYYKFTFDPIKGGDCALERFHWLDRRGTDLGGGGGGAGPVPAAGPPPTPPGGRGRRRPAPARPAPSGGVGERVGDVGVFGVEFGMAVVQLSG
ncbi:UNVERIFIED_CONTAM: hypothetical protein HDU68_012429 [Siphonaria sp. JEL0065]|nr:hypothetical protein HDU68_012429 [Siphonaria sp. JEL0065]